MNLPDRSPWLSLSLTLGTAAALALSAAGLPGCGGSAPDSGEAVVVTEPGVNPPTTGAAPAAPAAGGAAPAADAKAASTAPTAPAPAGKVEGWGTLKGQITFGGEPPSVAVLEEKGKAEKDPQYCAKDAPIVSQRLLVDSSSKGVKNALVYLPKPTAVNDQAKAAVKKAQVVFDQDKCIFEPHVLAVMAGEKIEIKSSDPVNHNVNAKLKNNSPFNSLLASGQTLPFTPNAAERAPAQVTCDIHPWMLAWWLVLDNPYFAVTDENGNYEIKNAPAGSQKVVVWHEATQYLTAPSGDAVDIPANGTGEKKVTIDPKQVKPAR